MRIVSWNCAGKFREKYKQIMELDADVYCIQECENPNTVSNKYIGYKGIFKNGLWKGYDTKGIGVFAKEDILLSNLCWEDFEMEHFISCNINNTFNLVNVWTTEFNGYIGGLHTYCNINKNCIDKNSIIIGDLNSNKIWDKSHKNQCHSAVVSKLALVGINSAYHTVFGVNQGEEQHNTFFHRSTKKGYHIDHCFCDVTRVNNYKVGEEIKWLKFSDHLPLILDIF